MVDDGPSSKKQSARASPDASLVNDNSFIRGVTSDASGISPLRQAPTSTSGPTEMSSTAWTVSA